MKVQRPEIVRFKRVVRLSLMLVLLTLLAWSIFSYFPRLVPSNGTDTTKLDFDPNIAEPLLTAEEMARNAGIPKCGEYVLKPGAQHVELTAILDTNKNSTCYMVVIRPLGYLLKLNYSIRFEVLELNYSLPFEILQKEEIEKIIKEMPPNLSVGRPLVRVYINETNRSISSPNYICQAAFTFPRFFIYRFDYIREFEWYSCSGDQGGSRAIIPGPIMESPFVLIGVRNDSSSPLNPTYVKVRAKFIIDAVLWR